MKKYSFMNPDYSLQNNLMAFGYSCDEGWFPLIEELLDKVQVIVDNDDKYKDLQLLQVKEKFSELRVYFNYYYPEIDDLVDEYTELSLQTCEKCGKPGESKGKNRWYKTLCPDCFSKW
jgi:ankyrin repeat protein